MIDFELGWRAVPGMFSPQDGRAFQSAVRLAKAHTSIVETGAWCGRSLAAACEALPPNVLVYSVDLYPEGSQATNDGTAPITPGVARNLRELVADHYRKRIIDRIVLCHADGADYGLEYGGPLVSTMLIDDHHSYEQINRIVDNWQKHWARECILLFHDYQHPPYRIVEACNERLPQLGFRFATQPSGSGLGIWSRGVL
ncbi:MAG: class I SAM-dependent methyltransferase [Salinibacterium sp.]|nr:MAG: class I SAM-dependent methyltransferase [Salinibacterium sp.]